MTDTHISFTDITTVSHYDTKGTPCRFQHIDIELSKEDSLAIGEYVRRIEGDLNRPADDILTRILRMGIAMAKQQVSLDKYLDERDEEAGK